MVTTIFHAVLLAATASSDPLLDLELSTPARRGLQEPEPGSSTPDPSPNPSPPPSPPLPPPRPPSSPLIATGCTGALGVSPSVSTVQSPSGAFVTPRALAFNPVTPGELYVADAGRDALTILKLTEGGTTVSTAESKVVKDRAQYHYMDHVSSISFDPAGQFATCQESVNTYEGKMLPNFFMGPTLYDSQLDYVNSTQRPCGPGDSCFLIHIDMLHESPLCMGIAHDNGAESFVKGSTWKNVYWAFGGGHRQLVRYDFEADHGPGSMEHDYASIRRYTGLELTRVEGVPSHMAMDSDSRELYIADTGADRVVKVNVDSGHFVRDARDAAPGHPAYHVYSSPNRAAFNYTVWDGLIFSTFASVPRPSGIALSSTTLYVGSHSRGWIYAFERSSGNLLQILEGAATADSLFGLALAPPSYFPTSSALSSEGTLFFLDSAADKIKYVVVDEACPATPSDNGCANGLVDGLETDVDCGGYTCARCAQGKTCTVDGDCATFKCTDGTCAAAVLLEHSATFLQQYLNSDFYANSFAHHLIHGDMGGASYLNPYPIMDAGFCETVGVDNETNTLNCSRVDFDALLLGGCWCHSCLPENPCLNGGTCVNYKFQGYTCDCAAGYAGDHCQTSMANGPSAEPLSSDFPFWMMPIASTELSGGGESEGEGVTQYTIRFEMVVDATVDTFDESGFTSSLAGMLGVSSSLITLAVSAASVKVQVTIVTTELTVKDALVTQIDACRTDTAACSVSLGSTIESLSAPSVRSSDDDDDSLSPGALAGIIVGACIAALVLLLIAGYLMRTKASQTAGTRTAKDPSMMSAA